MVREVDRQFRVEFFIILTHYIYTFRAVKRDREKKREKRERGRKERTSKRLCVLKREREDLFLREDLPENRGKRVREGRE